MVIRNVRRNFIVEIVRALCFVVLFGATPLLCRGDLTEELEAKMQALVADLEFGLPSYASQAKLEIESGPDSLHWFRGTADMKCFVEGNRELGNREFRKADWKLDTVDDTTSSTLVNKDGFPFNPGLFAFRNCSRSLVKYKSVFYDLDNVQIKGLVANRWDRTDGRSIQSSCVAIEPITWPLIYTTAFSRGMDQGKPLFRHFVETSLCGKVTVINSSTVKSTWYSKATTPSGQRLVFKDITFQRDLPTSVETYSYQAGFQDANDLPDRKKCVLINQVKTKWTKVDDVSVPEIVTARLQNAGFQEVSELTLTVKIKFWTERTKEYEEMKKVADEAFAAVEKISTKAK
jgi:hypothetical protein